MQRYCDGITTYDELLAELTGVRLSAAELNASQIRRHPPRL